MNALQEAIEERNQLHREWLTLYRNRPDGMKGDEHVVKLKELNDRMAPLGARIEDLQQQKAMADQAAEYEKSLAADAAPQARWAFDAGKNEPDERPTSRPQKSLGAMFIEDAAYKDFARNTRRGGQTSGVEYSADYGFKATFTTGGATVTQYDRQPGVVVLGTQMPSVADLLSPGQTTLNTVRYIREDTYTNAATTVSEGGTKPEATFDTSEVDAPVRKIAVTAKVTDELFADFPAIRDYIDQRMPLMVQQTEDTQLLTGDGNAPNLLGILNTVGILTQAKGADPTPDAVYKAMIKVMSTGYFMPDGAVFHPLDWQDVKLLRTSTGEYIWGNPADAAPDRIWGLRVAITTAMTQNTALVGAFKLGAQVFYREGIRVEATNTNSDDFVKNLITIRAEQREALAVYRPTAFSTVTGV
jgi:HK97 family phage major capsid protein